MTTTDPTGLHTGYTERISIDDLREGDRFMAIKYASMSRGAIYAQRFGTADMDGHAMSENYGFHVNDYWARVENRQKTYTNVCWDDPDEPYKTPWLWQHPNDTIHVTDAWVIYVQRETRDAIRRQKNEIRERLRLAAAESAKEKKIRDAVTAVNNAQTELRRAAQALADARAEV